MRVVAIVFVLTAVLRPEAALRYFPVLLHLALCWLFARTLVRNREPIISMIARLERDTLTAELARYTRRLTWVWTITFLLLAALSLSLAIGEFHTWASAMAYLPVAVLFFGEHLYRRIRYPHYEHASPWAVIRRIRESRVLTGLSK